MNNSDEPSNINKENIHNLLSEIEDMNKFQSKIQHNIHEILNLCDLIDSINCDLNNFKYLFTLINKEEIFKRHFEKSLVGDLHYKTPKILSRIILTIDKTDTLGSVLDLGCGTGLFGMEIKNYCSNLEGIDLSAKMLEIASKKNIYHKLKQYELIEFLQNEKLNYDYFVAADVFIYLGNLSQVFNLIRSKNSKSGKLVFSTEHTENDGFHLRKTGRYAHSKKYIEKLCKKYNYTITHFSTSKLRLDEGNFLIGGLYIIEF